MKGITPVVTVILLILLVVGAAGAFFYWSGAFQSDVSNKGQKQMDHYSTEAGKQLNIEAVSNCSIYVRNVGVEDVKSETINLVIDGRSVLFNSSSKTIGESELATLSINQNFSCARDKCPVKIVAAVEQIVNVDSAELQCIV